MNTNGTLRIQDVRAEDEGNYGCTAGNSGGFRRAEFRLIVQGKLTFTIKILLFSIFSFSSKCFEFLKFLD